MKRSVPLGNPALPIIMILLLCICYVPLSGQSYNKSNLEKYWRYRDRLKKDFLVVSAANTSGTNIPALTLYLSGGNKSKLDWEDANANMSHYIGMLATEYYLLKIKGGNYSETLAELYYAMAAIDRMDLNSESIFRGGAPQQSDLNGWMIRDDVNQNFWNIYHSQLGFPGTNYLELNSTNHRSDDKYLESISQDNIYHLLEALGLVKALVNGEVVKRPGYADQYVDFKTWSKDITRRSIEKTMQHTNPIYLIHKDGNDFQCWASPPRHWRWILTPDWALVQQLTYEALCSVKSRWYIQNPVNNQLALEGSGEDFDTWLYYSYGAARAANKILDLTGTGLHLDPSDRSLQEETFFSILDGSYQNDVGAVAAPFIETVGTGIVDAVASIAGIPPGSIPPGVKSDIVYRMIGDNPIDPYKVETLATVGKIGGDDTFWELRQNENQRYLHFHPMYAAMHGAPSTYSSSSAQFISDKNFYESFLSQAPCRGPRSYHLFAGDDYSYEWSTPSRLVWPEFRERDLGSTAEYNGLDYMLLHNLYCIVYNQDFRRLTEQEDTNITSGSFTQSAVDIIGKNVISPSTNVTYTGHISVKLIPGFHAKAGSIFKANIVSSSVNYAGYSQLNVCTNLPVSQRTATKVKSKALMAAPSHDKLIAVPEEEQNSVLTVYPNPANDVFVVKILPLPETLNDAVVTVTDITGVVVKKQSFSRLGEAIDMKGLSKGIYFVKVTANNQNYQSKVIIR